jgi:hypothetical protein
MKLTAAILLSLVLIALPAQAAGRMASKTQTIRLVSKTVETKTLLDRAPKGPSAGDKIWAKSRLRNEVAQFGRAEGAVVGFDVAVTTLISAARTKFAVNASLPGGKIRSGGTVTDLNQNLRVTGGTGAFVGARGTITAVGLDLDGDPALNIYRLRFPERQTATGRRENACHMAHDAR